MPYMAGVGSQTSAVSADELQTVGAFADGQAEVIVRPAHRGTAHTVHQTRPAHTALPITVHLPSAHL